MWVLEVEADSRSLLLVQGEWTLGRSGNVLNFTEDKSISRNHAEFQVGGLQDLENIHELPSFVLIDKKSRFGTYLNDIQISPNVPMSLRAGDKISFGAKKTIIRVRYMKMIARTTRVHKANRKKLLDGCKAIGMHVVNSPVDDVNYCITDPGKFVATEKILWALAHNHPIVSSEWVQAVLRRKSLAEELPRCEDYSPENDTPEENGPSYRRDPRRHTLYSKYSIVFLAPSSMEALIPVMGGEVIVGYRNNDVEFDDPLVDEMRKSSRKCLVIYPVTYSEGQQSEKQSMSKALSSMSSRDLDPSVARRLHKLQHLNFTIVLHQELAASILFTTPPQYLSDGSISQLLGPNSFSESHHEVVPATVPSPPIENKRINSEHFEQTTIAKATPNEDTSQRNSNKPSEPAKSIRDTTEPIGSSSMEFVEETKMSAINPNHAPIYSTNSTVANLQEPDDPHHDIPMDNMSPQEEDIAIDHPSESNIVENIPPSETIERINAPARWITKPLKRNFPRPVTEAEDDEDAAQAPQITTCPLVIRRNNLSEETTIRYLPRNGVPQERLKNAKRFRKSHVLSSRRMITQFKNEVPVNLERRREYDRQREELEAREQLAEALFESNMQPTQKTATQKKITSWRK